MLQRAVARMNLDDRRGAREWTSEMGWRAQERDQQASRLESRRRAYNTYEAQHELNKRARRECMDAEMRRLSRQEFTCWQYGYKEKMNDAAARRREIELWEDYSGAFARGNAPSYSPPVQYQPTSPSYNPVALSYTPTSPSHSPPIPLAVDHGPASHSPPHDEFEHAELQNDELQNDEPITYEPTSPSYVYEDDPGLARARQIELAGFNNDLVVQAEVARKRARARRAAAREAPESEPEPARAPAEGDFGPMGECLVCGDAPRTHLCAPCGHLCFCVDCSIDMDACPVCREDAWHILKLYVP